MAAPLPIPLPRLLPAPARTRRRWWTLRWVLAAIPTQGQPQRYERARDASQVAPGQIAAFEHFFRQFEPRISGYLWHMVRDEQAAYDLSQEAFLRAWEHFAAISAYPQPQAWLFRVATNLALEHLRRRATAPGAASPLTDDLEASGNDSIAQLCERDIVMQALRTLPPKQQALLMLREVYGFSTAEAGQALGISLAAAQRMLSRSHRRFRQAYLRKEGEGQG